MLWVQRATAFFLLLSCSLHAMNEASNGVFFAVVVDMHAAMTRCCRCVVCDIVFSWMASVFIWSKMNTTVMRWWYSESMWKQSGLWKQTGFPVRFAHYYTVFVLCCETKPQRCLALGWSKALCFVGIVMVCCDNRSQVPNATLSKALCFLLYCHAPLWPQRALSNATHFRNRNELHASLSWGTPHRLLALVVVSALICCGRRLSDCIQRVAQCKTNRSLSL